MKLGALIRGALYEPGVGQLDVDGADLIVLHRKALESKALLRSAFDTFYRNMIDSCERWLPAQGLEIELGSGVGFFKKIRPDVITSDVRPIPGIDRTLDAERMDLGDATVRCIYAINVFHHLPHPEQFFEELCRVLKPGGGCILIEPHNGLASRCLHRHLHKDERFDPLASWTNADIDGPLSGANQALAHIVFDRDRDRYEARFGTRLEIVDRYYCLNALRYFFSGGLNFRSLLPAFAGSLLQAGEQAFRPLARHWSFHQATVLRRSQHDALPSPRFL